MLPDQLIKYLEQCKSTNTAWEQVEVQLKNLSWSPEIISSAQKWYSTPVHAPVVVNDHPTPPPRRILPAILLTVFSLLLLAAPVSAYLIATEKIEIPNPKIQQTVYSLVTKIPFMPKTPRAVIQSAILAHKDVHKNSFDFSISAASKSFASVVGTDSIDLQIKGYSDVSDIKNSKTDFTASITKEFNIEVKKPDQMLYFKINQIPALVSGYFAQNSEKLDQLKNVWVAYDTSSLDSPARQELEKQQGPDQSISNQKLNEFLTSLWEEKILPSVKMTSEDLDGRPMYKLEIQPSDEVLDDVIENIGKELEKLSNNVPSVLGISTMEIKKDKPSDYIKNPKITFLIDKKSNYVNQFTTSFSIENKKPASPNASAFSSLQDTQVNVATVLKLSNFGEAKDISAPDNSISTEEFYKRFFAILNIPEAGDTLPSQQLPR